MDNGVELFADKKYLVRRKVFTLFGGAFHVYDSKGKLAAYSKMKAFKLKEDIRLYKDQNMLREIVSIQARQIIDFSAAYDVVDPQTRQKLGVLKRKGMKSILKDEWIIMDANDHQIGHIKEDSAFWAFFRRFLANIIPQTYNVEIAGKKVCELKQHFNPFIFKFDVDFSLDKENKIDKRMGIAMAILLAAIEGRQQ